MTFMSQSTTDQPFMAPKQKHLYILHQAFPRIKNQVNSTYDQPPLPSPESSFPTLAIVVLSIMATAFLLVSYYLIVVKFCSNQLNLLIRFSTLRVRQNEEMSTAFSPSIWNRGLDESAIRGIPTVQFKGGIEVEERNVYGCAVCLKEFQEQETLKVLPSCSHEFHLDCIDTWLQSNDNCPLCRISVSGTIRCPADHAIAPSSSPQDSDLFSTSLIGSEEDFVVIELGGEEMEAHSIKGKNKDLIL